MPEACSSAATVLRLSELPIAAGKPCRCWCDVQVYVLLQMYDLYSRERIDIKADIWVSAAASVSCAHPSLASDLPGCHPLLCPGS